MGGGENDDRAREATASSARSRPDPEGEVYEPTSRGKRFERDGGGGDRPRGNDEYAGGYDDFINFIGGGTAAEVRPGKATRESPRWPGHRARTGPIPAEAGAEAATRRLARRLGVEPPPPRLGHRHAPPPRPDEGVHDQQARVRRQGEVRPPPEREAQEEESVREGVEGPHTEVPRVLPRRAEDGQGRVQQVQGGGRRVTPAAHAGARRQGEAGDGAG
ncbi:hypothetical protein THAOC_00148, partial [Thalassiosira oceanica]